VKKNPAGQQVGFFFSETAALLKYTYKNWIHDEMAIGLCE